MILGPMTLAQWKERIRRALGGVAPRIQAAALPYRKSRGKVQILLVTSQRTGRWILPKGWPEPGETLSASALREAREEAGINGRISPAACGVYLHDKILPTGLAQSYEVHVFPLLVESVKSDWPEKNDRVRNWVSQRKAARMVSEPDLAELITTFGDNPRVIAA